MSSWDRGDRGGSPLGGNNNTNNHSMSNERGNEYENTSRSTDHPTTSHHNRDSNISGNHERGGE
eukprot:8838777-Ditylum_brightwellii.AAC.1